MTLFATSGLDDTMLDRIADRVSQVRLVSAGHNAGVPTGIFQPAAAGLGGRTEAIPLHATAARRDGLPDRPQTVTNRRPERMIISGLQADNGNGWTGRSMDQTHCNDTRESDEPPKALE